MTTAESEEREAKGNKTPTLLVFLFGEAAETAQRGISPRLERWSQAFEAWLEDRQQRYKPGILKKAKLSWRRLLGERGKMPWELEQKDIEAHADWMEAKGYAPTTIGNAMGEMASFFRWCDERRVDPECEAGFNPAAGARRPKFRRYAGATLLSEGERRALLGILRRDVSPLGKRDYAFFLARLSLGAPLRSLQHLQWGQIEHDEGGSWVRWRAGDGRVRLPGEVWEAIRAALEASGRLDGVDEDSYIFASLADPYQAEGRERAEAWVEGRPLSTSQLLSNLKLYGRRVVIPEEKLTLLALRRTATRLRLEAGDSLEEMRAFLDCREGPRFTKSRLKSLPKLPQDTAQATEGEEPPAPVREPRPFQPGDGMKHGLYAQSQPAEAVRAVLRENIRGVAEEITGLRTLGRGLLEKQGKAHSSKEAAQLSEAYTLAAARLAVMVEAEKKLAENEKAKGRKGRSWAEEMLARLDEVAIQMGGEPVSEAARAEARGGEPELSASDLRLVEEIAATRHILRRTLALAKEAEQKREAGEFIHLTEIYGSGCNRLMRLLRTEKEDQDQLDTFLRGKFDLAIQELNEEWGL